MIQSKQLTPNLQRTTFNLNTALVGKEDAKKSRSIIITGDIPEGSFPSHIHSLFPWYLLQPKVLIMTTLLDVIFRERTSQLKVRKKNVVLLPARRWNALATYIPFLYWWSPYAAPAKISGGVMMPPTYKTSNTRPISFQRTSNWRSCLYHVEPSSLEHRNILIVQNLATSTWRLARFKHPQSNGCQDFRAKAQSCYWGRPLLFLQNCLKIESTQKLKTT